MGVWLHLNNGIFWSTLPNITTYGNMEFFQRFWNFSIGKCSYTFWIKDMDFTDQFGNTSIGKYFLPNGTLLLVPQFSRIEGCLYCHIFPTPWQCIQKRIPKYVISDEVANYNRGPYIMCSCCLTCLTSNFLYISTFQLNKDAVTWQHKNTRKNKPRK